jgi:hypothetical protein
MKEEDLKKYIERKVMGRFVGYIVGLELNWYMHNKPHPEFNMGKSEDIKLKRPALVVLLKSESGDMKPKIYDYIRTVMKMVGMNRNRLEILEPVDSEENPPTTIKKFKRWFPAIYR